jgi:hypothetical protein
LRLGPLEGRAQEKPLKGRRQYFVFPMGMQPSITEAGEIGA